MSAKFEYLVFTDVDETLIRAKSMVAFLDYFLARSSFASSAEAARVRDESRLLAAAHVASADRELLNLQYYRMFRGIACTDLRAAGEAWLSESMTNGELFVSATLEELRAHQASGAGIVLVSGSFFEVLEPIREYLGATALLCTETESVAGKYTGKVLQQVIGEGKWLVIARYLRGVPYVQLEECFAYGDHASDLSFMERVGHPVVVGDSPALLAIAKQRSWRVLPRN